MTCYVVFIQCSKGGAIKIGVAADPDKQLKNLQIGNPFSLSVLASIPCPSRKSASKLYADLLRRFSYAHIRGDWYQKGIKFSDINPPRETPKDFKKRYLEAKTPPLLPLNP